MIRKMVEIDSEKCIGCGLCVNACHEGAIGMVDGKAKLLREDYCDGLGNCLPACPVEAISIVEREAVPFDKAAVEKAQAAAHDAVHAQGGCPSARAMNISRPASEPAAPVHQTSELASWPVQIQLVPVNAPYFNGASLLIAADCCAYAYAGFHAEFMKNRVTIIGCPKLDAVDYTEKLTEILKRNDIQSVTIARMEVPCCGGLAHAATEALKACGKMIPWRVITLSIDGSVLSDR